MCLRLKGDCVCVCIFHQRTDFLYCTILSLYFGLIVHLGVFKAPICTFYSFSGMSPFPFSISSKYQSKSKINPFSYNHQCVDTDEKAITFSISSVLLVQRVLRQK